MYTPAIRWLLVLVSVGFGVYELCMGDLRGLLLLFAVGLLIFGHFRYGTVWLAWRAARGGNRERAAALLSRVQSVDSLNSQNRAYYHLLQGLLASTGEQSEAAAHLEKVSKAALRTDNDRCLLACLRTSNALKQGDRSDAEASLQEARTYPQNPRTQKLLEKIEEEFREAGEP